MRRPSLSSSKQEASAKPGAVKRGPWTAKEDEILAEHVRREGEGRWRTLPKKAGLLRCGKSCRLRWMNYLRPSLKHGNISPDEEDLILRLHRLLGNRWSLIAGRIPGRTDNEIKNYWNTHLSKKLISQGIDPATHKPLMNPIFSGDQKRASCSLETLVLQYDPSHPLEQHKTMIMPVTNIEDDQDRGGYEQDHDVEADRGDQEDEDVLIVFLNSLINEDMFNNHPNELEQEQQQRRELMESSLVGEAGAPAGDVSQSCSINANYGAS